MFREKTMTNSELLSMAHNYLWKLLYQPISFAQKPLGLSEHNFLLHKTYWSNRPFFFLPSDDVFRSTYFRYRAIQGAHRATVNSYNWAGRLGLYVCWAATGLEGEQGFSPTVGFRTRSNGQQNSNKLYTINSKHLKQ